VRSTICVRDLVSKPGETGLKCLDLGLQGSPGPALPFDFQADAADWLLATLVIIPTRTHAVALN
jgi:hypothetical protein